MKWYFFVHFLFHHTGFCADVEFVFAIPYSGYLGGREPRFMISTTEQRVNTTISISAITFQDSYSIDKNNGAEFTLPHTSHIQPGDGKQNKTKQLLSEHQTMCMLLKIICTIAMLFKLFQLHSLEQNLTWHLTYRCSHTAHHSYVCRQFTLIRLFQYQTHPETNTISYFNSMKAIDTTEVTFRICLVPFYKVINL